MKKERSAKRLSLYQKHNLWGYLFTSPWIIGFLFLFLIPFITAIRFSLNQITLNADSGYTLKWVGSINYENLFLTHPSFRQTLISSIGQMLLNLPFILIFSMFAALLINSKFRGRTLVRAVFFLPVILGSGVAQLLSNSSWTDAVLNGSGELSGTVGAISGSDFLADYLTDIFGIMNVDIIDTLLEMASSVREIIQHSGVQILIFLAGLQSISPSMYEASKIEGATAWESFWKITFPMISPMILVNIIYTVVDNFSDSSNEMMTLIADTAFFKTADLSASTAMAMVYFITMIICLAVIVGICAKLMLERNK